MAAPDSKITEIPNVCPRCQGPIYDNTKGRGKTNPKSPDARCRDRDNCGWAGWLPEGSKPARGASRGPQQYPWGPLLKLCVQYVQKEISPLFQNPPATPEMIKELATTLFITSAKEGGDIFKKAEVASPAAPVAPIPPPAPQPRRAEYDDTMEDLPF